MGTVNEKDGANTMGLRSHSRHRLRGRGTASAVEGAKFAMLRNFCVRFTLKLLGIDPTPTINKLLQIKLPCWHSHELK